MADDSFELFDLRVEAVVPEGKPIYCGAKAGDYFELRGEMLSMPAGQGWSPLVYRHSGSNQAIGVGFISIPGSEAIPRTVVTLDQLPGISNVSAHEITDAGPRHVTGRLGETEMIETHSAPLYMYRLTA